MHVPFCRRRCDYCAFSITTGHAHLADAFATACRAEIERAVADESLPPATSVYFGGGTPSRLEPELLVAILDAIPRAPDAEVTVECNPEDVSSERLRTYRAGGVDRLSLGVQSTVPHVLAGLGRVHGAAEGLEAAAAVGGAGFRTWNADLIIGGAGETDTDWERSLGDLLELAHPPPHLSAYTLTVEPGTPLARRRGSHPDEEVLAARYERTDRVLGAAGYRWEEISNWALPGHGCRHNRLYWSQGDYRGFGPAAHSHRGGRRWRNVTGLERFVARIGAGTRATVAEEVLDAEERALEALALRLRTPAGVPAAALGTGAELAGLLEHDADTVRLTVRGRLLADAVSTRLRTGDTREGEGGTSRYHSPG